jgi:hypothetical protein
MRKYWYQSHYYCFYLNGSDKKNADSQNYIAGFKTVQTKDTTRVYKPNTDTTDYLHLESFTLISGILQVYPQGPYLVKKTQKP